jgi:hypothetical protein
MASCDDDEHDVVKLAVTVVVLNKDDGDASGDDGA